MPITKETRRNLPSRGQGKLNKTVKETVLAVFNQLQSDPKVKLVQWAKDEPTEFYRIAAKLIPTEVTAKIDSKINLHIVRGKSSTQPTSSGTGTGLTTGEEV